MSINFQKQTALDTSIIQSSSQNYSEITERANLQNKPIQYVLIMGSGRSGTTWLGQIMNMYQNCIYKYEPFLNSKRTPYTVWKNNLNTDDLEKLRHDFWSLCRNCHYGVDVPPFPPKSFRTQNKEILHFLYGLGKRVNLSKNLYEWYGSPQLAQDTSVLIKDVNFPNHMLPRLQEVLQPHLIALVRNPFGNIASYLKGVELSLFGQEYTQQINRLEQQLTTPEGQHLSQYRQQLKNMSAAQFAAVCWRFQVEPLVNFVRSHEKGFLVVYEDLCTNPHGQITEIFDFVGWKVDQAVHDFIDLSTAIAVKNSQSSKAYYSVYRDPKHSMSKWKTQLTKEQQAEIASIIVDSPLKNLWSDLPL
jgi:hypothetical protein